jgi:alpha-amylase/alpha-mannosidase (GH57 family)
MSLPVALVVHGHFYQPPRENPWTDELTREPSAAPFHDWNARIHAECYGANAFARIHDGQGRIESIVNNYERLSFNFGPTLARWIERHDPRADARLRLADADARRRLGHGNALAQAYAHPIVPLLAPADQRTQLLWGLADFRRRFGRDADGLWLPETAVSPATLEALIDLGVKLTILAPEQIAAVRPEEFEREPDDGWRQVDRDSIDTGRAYFWRHRDGSGRRIAIAVFDGPLSRGVAFSDTASHSEAFLSAVHSSADRSRSEVQRLVLCASDGELWGHHKKFADLTLAFATHVEAARRGIEVTNLAAYLARHPPTWEVKLAPGPNGEGTAWSCSHGLGRWYRDCGCHMGGNPGWNQKWRGPLRQALDLIRDSAAAFYEEAAAELLIDPWGARDAYGEAVDEPVPVRDHLLAELGRPALHAGGEAARLRARRLLDLQRATLLMYASCGWFFDDVAGLEAALVIRMGAHAMDLMREAGGTPPERDVLDALAEARSNRREMGNGADVFARVAADRVTSAHAIGRAALGTLVASGPALGAGPSEVPGFDVTFLHRSEAAAPAGATLSGRARARHRRTGAVDDADFLALARRGGALEVRVGSDHLSLADLGDEAGSALLIAQLPSLVEDAGDIAVARLILQGARGMPPDQETPEGVARRALLTRAVSVLLSPGPKPPSIEALQIASELLDLADLAPGSHARRELEELVFEQLDRGRPPAALRVLATKLGFAKAVSTEAPQTSSQVSQPSENAALAVARRATAS